jgi:hypothetical protein
MSLIPLRSTSVIETWLFSLHKETDNHLSTTLSGPVKSIFEADSENLGVRGFRSVHAYRSTDVTVRIFMTMSPAKLTSKLRIFLSYRSVEARFADVLKVRLTHDFIGMVDVFLASDTTSIPAGANWHLRVLEGLNTSDLHIVICSNFSVRCPWINYEAGAAALRGTPIVPLCHSGLLPHQLPVPLSESEGGVITDSASIHRLYARVADLIGCGVPNVNFEQYATAFVDIQEQLHELVARGDQAEPAGAEPDLIRRPHVVCVTSQQFKELGYANQLELVLRAFPESIDHDVVLNSADLTRILLEERVHIVHIAAFVCPRGGDLYFTPVTLPLGESAVENPDVVSPEVLVSLLKKANTRLVVLGASASLVLGAQLLPVTNVIAVRDMVSAKAMASWVDTFYKMLTQQVPLPRAFELASEISQAPMRLYGQSQVPSVKFEVTNRPAEVS